MCLPLHTLLLHHSMELFAAIYLVRQPQATVQAESVFSRHFFHQDILHNEGFASSFSGRYPLVLSLQNSNCLFQDTRLRYHETLIIVYRCKKYLEKVAEAKIKEKLKNIVMNREMRQKR